MSGSRSSASHARRRPRVNAEAPALPRPDQVGQDKPPLGVGAQVALGACAALVVLIGATPVGRLADLVGVSWPTSAQSTNAVAATLVGVAVVAGLGWPYLDRRLSPSISNLGERLRPVARLDKRLEFGRVIDPYLVVGGILLVLGRLSAAIIDNTLGRLVRAS
jgi:hypothetical protein